MNDWRVALLKSIGAKPTKQNLRFLDTWQRWEGGHTNNNARFNWLNTTHGNGRSINSVGVKAFGSFRDGIRNTAATLNNGRYPDLLKALRSGNPYKMNPTAGLQVWVSGRPDGNPGYADKVLGRPAVKRKMPTVDFSAPAPAQRASNEAWDYAMSLVFADDPEMIALMSGMDDFDIEPRSDPGPTHAGTPRRVSGKTLQPGTSWSGSHVTDGLDWNGGRKTAVDIMASPGTAVLAPEGGTVVKHGSAQGGQALYFLSDSGHLYWMGHIEGMVPVGTTVKRGQRIAAISSDHADPHLHIDRYYGKDPGRYT